MRSCEVKQRTRSEANTPNIMSAGRQSPREHVESADEDRHRFRRPLALAAMAYKALLALGELVAGVALAIPSFHIAAVFHRLAAGELREDPGDAFVAFVSRHLPSLIAHRQPVAVALILLGSAKLIAAAGMWYGKEWGRYLLAAIVIGFLPLDVYAAVENPSLVRFLFVVANVGAAWLLTVGIGRMGRQPRSQTADHRQRSSAGAELD